MGGTWLPAGRGCAPWVYHLGTSGPKFCSFPGRDKSLDCRNLTGSCPLVSIGQGQSHVRIMGLYF